ncbi:MAG: OadG family protein [Gammaproteobacteria bacterium]
MLIDQLTQAATLFGLGMGTVFLLLSLLITCISLLSAACLKFEKNPVHAVPDIGITAPSRKASASQSSISEQEKSIVIAAVQAHRQAKGL